MQDKKNTSRQPILSSKKDRLWYWLPISVFVLGVLSIGMLIWNDRIREKQRKNFDLFDAMMDIQILIAKSHIVVEEKATGDEVVDIQEVKDYLDSAVGLTEAVLIGGKSEHGFTVEPLKDSKLQERVEEIKSLLTRYRALALQRNQEPEKSAVDSTLYENFHATFKELQHKAKALEIALERDYFRAYARMKRLWWGVFIAWILIVVGATVGIWNREARRRAAEKELQKANEQLQSQTEELKKYQEHLKELVEERTSDLTTAIRFYKQEITERKQAEESLRASENKFRTLVENLPQKVCLKDKNGTYLYCNEKVALDLSAGLDEIIGKTDYDFYPKELADKHIAEDKGIMESGQTVETEERDDKNGREVVILKIKLPIRNEKGEISGILDISSDVTERIRLESIAEAANLMENIGYVISGIRHELGNPINTIKMTLGTLANKIEDSSPKETLKKYVEWTVAEISRMEYLLKALKNFNLYENPEPQNIPMKSFLDKFLFLVTADFAKKGITIESLIQPGAEWGYADPRALQQVMLNIMNNASDALEGRKDPKIVIDVLKADDRIRIRVNDNGSGMSEEQQKDLFKLFRTSKPEGTGLGLVIAKKMLAGMNGTIEIKSLKDKGTTVDIFIPKGKGEEIP